MPWTSRAWRRRTGHSATLCKTCSWHVWLLWSFRYSHRTSLHGFWSSLQGLPSQSHWLFFWKRSIPQCCLRWSHDLGTSHQVLAGIVPGRIGPSAWWHWRWPRQSCVGFSGAVQCAASDQSVVSPALSASHGTGHTDVPNVSLADDDEVYQVPVFRPRVHPGGLVLVCHPEQGVGDAEEQAVVIDFAYSVSAQNAFPATVVPSHSRIKVSKND